MLLWNKNYQFNNCKNLGILKTGEKRGVFKLLACTVYIYLFSVGLSQKEKKRSSISSLKPVVSNRPLTPEFLHPSPVAHKSSKEVARNGVTKITIPPKEDDIKTMMEIIPTDSDAVRFHNFTRSFIFCKYFDCRKNKIRGFFLG